MRFKCFSVFCYSSEIAKRHFSSGEKTKSAWAKEDKVKRESQSSV